LLLFITGMTINERPSHERQYKNGNWPEYSEYLNRTSCLIPFPPSLYVLLPQSIKSTLFLEFPIYRYTPESDGGNEGLSNVRDLSVSDNLNNPERDGGNEVSSNVGNLRVSENLNAPERDGGNEGSSNVRDLRVSEDSYQSEEELMMVKKIKFIQGFVAIERGRLICQLFCEQEIIHFILLFYNFLYINGKTRRPQGRITDVSDLE
ncbi:2487_t:CDS:2, partial [Acaulospora morrowiae]